MRRCLACERTFVSEEWLCPGCGRRPHEEHGYPSFAPELSAGDDNDADYAYGDLFEAEARHFWFRSRNRLVVWALGRYFPEAHSLLEIGCGTGFVLAGIRRAFPGLALAGSEVRADGLRYAASRLACVSLFQMDARRIPFRGEFDVVGAFDVLEHVMEDELVLSEMRRALKPHGGILLTVPQHRFLWSPADDFSRHKRRYSRVELVEKVERAGFRVLRITSFFSLLLPLLVAFRWRQRRAPTPFDPKAEFEISPGMNLFLEQILRLERVSIRAGCSFPAGGSLLLAGRR